MKNAVFWDVKPCGSRKNRCFEGIYHLHHEGQRNLTAATRCHIPEDVILQMKTGLFWGRWRSAVWCTAVIYQMSRVLRKRHAVSLIQYAVRKKFSPVCSVGARGIDVSLVHG
jgi:hypothetical protein